VDYSKGLPPQGQFVGTTNPARLGRADGRLSAQAQAAALDPDIERQHCRVAMVLLERCHGNQLLTSDVYAQLRSALDDEMAQLAPEKVRASPPPAIGQEKIRQLKIAGRELPAPAQLRAAQPPQQSAPPSITGSYQQIRGKPRCGDVLADRYVLVESIGQSSLTYVFKALDRYRAVLPESERYVTLKCLLPDLQDDPLAIAELHQEYLQLQGLSHANIPRCYDFVRTETTCCLASEYVQGEDLARVVERLQPRRIPLSTALALIREVAAALAHANGRGVRHGNLSADKVVLTEKNQLRVLDIGHAPTFCLKGLPAGSTEIPEDDLCGLARIADLLINGGRWVALTNPQHRTKNPLSSAQRRCLERGLQPAPDQPDRTVRAWLAELNVHAADLQLPAPQTIQPAAEPKISMKLGVIIGLSVLGTAAVAIGLILILQ
jgi:hypothetical protein